MTPILCFSVLSLVDLSSSFSTTPCGYAISDSASRHTFWALHSLVLRVCQPVLLGLHFRLLVADANTWVWNCGHARLLGPHALDHINLCSLHHSLNRSVPSPLISISFGPSSSIIRLMHSLTISQVHFLSKSRCSASVNTLAPARGHGSACFQWHRHSAKCDPTLPDHNTTSTASVFLFAAAPKAPPSTVIFAFPSASRFAKRSASRFFTDAFLSPSVPRPLLLLSMCLSFSHCQQ